MFKVRIATIAIIVGGILLAALSFLLPVPHISNSVHLLIDKETFHSSLAGFAISITFGVGGSLLLLLGLRGFSGAFRRTYYFICAGLITQGLGGIVNLVGLYTGTVKTDGLFFAAEIPLAVGIAIVFIGYMKYARLLRISSWSTQPLTIAGGLIVLMALAWFLPHRADTGGHNEFLFDIGHAFQAVELAMYCLVSILVMRIRSTAAPMYSRSLLWFMLATITAFPPTLGLFLQDYYAIFDSVNIDALSLLFIVNSVLVVVSGYVFNKLARMVTVQETHNNALLDSVIFLSSLVSNPSEVDPILDKVRLMTSAHETNTPLTTAETAELRNVYKQLEDYLVTKEQLRAFDRKGLDELVQERFNIAAVQA